jgi:hypothetical protein
MLQVLSSFPSGRLGTVRFQIHSIFAEIALAEIHLPF